MTAFDFTRARLRARLLASALAGSAFGALAGLAPEAALATPPPICGSAATTVCTGASTGETLNDQPYASVTLGAPPTAFTSTGPVYIEPNTATALTVTLEPGSSIDTGAAGSVTALSISDPDGAGALAIDNAGAIHADGVSSIGLAVTNVGDNHPVTLDNSGAVSGDVIAVYIDTQGASDVTVHSSGAVQSASGDAFYVSTTGNASVGTADARLTTGTTTETGVAGGATAISVIGNIDSHLAVYAGAGTFTGTGFAAIRVTNNDQADSGGAGDAVVDVEGATIKASNYGISVSEYDGDAATVRLGVGGAATVINSGSDGINASSNGSGGDVTVEVGGNVAINAASNTGVAANGYGAAGGDVSVTTAAGSTIGVLAADNHLTSGIVATSGNGGHVTINAQGDIGYSATDGVDLDGIAGTTSGAGTVDITAGGTIYSDSNGVRASSADGAVSVTLSDDAVVYGASVGVQASASGLGNVTIEVGAGAQVVASGGTAEGLYLGGSSGELTATVGAGAHVSSGYIGLYASGGSAVSVSVDQDSVVTGALAGVYANTAGSIALSTDAGSDVEAGSYGVYAYSTGGDASVNIDGSIGADSAGLYGALAAVTAGSGDAVVATGADSAITATTRGVSATNAGSGEIEVTVAGKVTAGTGYGVYAGDSGTGDTTVTLDPTAVVSAVGGTGVSAASSGNGNVTVVADGAVTAGTGIVAQTGGAAHARVVVGGSVDAGGSAIVLASGGNGAVTLDAGAAVRGLGDEDHAVISVAQGAGATTTLTLQAGALAASNAGDASDLVLAAAGATGKVAIANAGTLVGRIDLSSLTDTGGATVFANSGTWTTSGASAFSAGNPAANGLTNTGTIVAEGVTRLDNLASLTNAGLIDLRSGGAGRLSISGAYVGAGGVLALDASLGGPGSAADRLEAASASGTGAAILVEDTRGAYAAYVPAGQGIRLVSTTGANTLAFTLDSRSSGYTAAYGTPALQKGLWLYTLVDDAGGAALVSTPGPEAHQFAAEVSAAQTLWNMAPAWADRADRAAPEPGVWLKAIGDWTARRRHAGAGGLTFDTGYDQTTGGLAGGADAGAANLLRDGDRALGGIEAAYLDSQLDFRGSPASGRYSGYSVGLYGAYRSGPLFVTGEAKGDILSLTRNAPEIAWRGKGDVRTWGGRIEAGAALPLGPGEIRPLAGLSYATTATDDAHVAGATVRAPDAGSLRGTLGVRYAAVLTTAEAYVLRASGEARVWDEFEGRNKVVLMSAGPDVAVRDDLSGVFGEFGLGLDVASRDGRASGFLDASVKAKHGYTEAGLGLGFRVAFGPGGR